MHMSVIVTSYNEPRLLDVTLTALSRQRAAPRFEVIVADDGSSDAPLATTREVASKHALDVRFVWQPDRGFRLARARNNAIRCAQGELLLFLDGDMWIPSDYLRAHADAHDGSARVVCGTRRHVDLSVADALDDPDGLQQLADRSWPDGDRPRQLAAPASEHPWLALVGFCFSAPRRPEVRFDERMEGWGAEDKEIALRLFHRHGYEFRCPPELKLLYHLRTRFRASHERIVAGIRNNLHILANYSWEEAAPAMECMRYWVLDAASDQWLFGNRRDGSLREMVELAARWMEDRRLLGRAVAAV